MCWIIRPSVRKSCLYIESILKVNLFAPIRKEMYIFARLESDALLDRVIMKKKFSIIREVKCKMKGPIVKSPSIYNISSDLLEFG